MISFIKAKLLLLSVAFVWLYLIYLMLPFQLFITVLPLIIKNKKIIKYRYNFWIWQDQGVNILFFGNPDITVSSRVGWMAEQGSKTAKAMAKVIDWLFYIAIGQRDHCAVSIERDEDHTK